MYLEKIDVLGNASEKSIPVDVLEGDHGMEVSHPLDAFTEDDLLNPTGRAAEIVALGSSSIFVATQWTADNDGTQLYGRILS